MVCLRGARREASHGEEVSSCKESFLPAGVVVAADGQGRGLRTGGTACIGGGTGDGVYGCRCPFGHPVELGCADHHQDLYLEHDGAELPLVPPISRLHFQLRGRREIRLDEGILSVAVCRGERLDREGSLAHHRQQLGCQRDHHLLTGVVDS